MKTLLEMDGEQVNMLAKICKRDGISRAEAIRRAIDYYGSHVLAPPDADAYFGYFKNRGIDSQAYVDKLRNEWN